MDFRGFTNSDILVFSQLFSSLCKNVLISNKKILRIYRVSMPLIKLNTSQRTIVRASDESIIVLKVDHAIFTRNLSRPLK